MSLGVRLLIALGTALAASGAASSPAGTVWDRDGSDSLPLDVVVLRRMREGDVEIEVLRYTSALWKGQPLRILALYGRPPGAGPFPAILHFHGGGQTASPRDVAECVGRGYACLSFDWTGPREGRTEVTEWPAEIASHYVADESNKLRHAVLAARRGISFLAGRPEVDPERIGEYGISWGGYCTWLLNGTDARLKACVPVYGCGGLLAEGRGDRPVAPAELEAWSASFEPLRYGVRQHAPVLHVNGTNDFFGWPAAGRRLLRSCTVSTRQVYTPGINHGVGPDAAAAAYAWLDHHLQGAPPLPESPRLDIAPGEDGVPWATVGADPVADVEFVRVDYSIGTRAPPGRCWRAVPARNVGSSWRCALPVVDVAEPLHAIAQVRYRRGLRLSSVPEIVVPKNLGAARATLRPTPLLSDFSDGLGGWAPVFGSTQLYGARQDIALDPRGFQGGPCLRVVPLTAPVAGFAVTCWRPADPQWNGGDADALSLWIRGAERAVTLVATECVRQPGERAFRLHIKLNPEKDWQRIVARRTEFRPVAPLKRGSNPARETPANWRNVESIQIAGRIAPGDTVLIGPAHWTTGG